MSIYQSVVTIFIIYTSIQDESEFAVFVSYVGQSSIRPQSILYMINPIDIDQSKMLFFVLCTIHWIPPIAKNCNFQLLFFVLSLNSDVDESFVFLKYHLLAKIATFNNCKCQQELRLPWISTINGDCIFLELQLLMRMRLPTITTLNYSQELQLPNILYTLPWILIVDRNCDGNCDFQLSFFVLPLEFQLRLPTTVG